MWQQTVEEKINGMGQNGRGQATTLSSITSYAQLLKNPAVQS